MMSFDKYFKLPQIIFSFLFILFFIPLSIDAYHYLSYKTTLVQNNARIDFSVTNSESFANIEFINDGDQDIQSNHPDWIKSKYGKGGVITVQQNLLDYKQHTIRFKANSDCSVLISFLGEDRRLNNKRYPVFSKYKDIVINKEKLNLTNTVAWHDKRITKKIILKKDEVYELTFKSKKHFPHFSDYDTKPKISLTSIFLIIIAAFIFGSIIGKNYNSSTISNSEKKRVAYYDFLRIISILFVIYNHTDGFHFYLKGIDQGLIEYCHIALSVFTKFNVPMFFLITGALLLGKDESISLIFRKRFLKILTVVTTFTIIDWYITYLQSGTTHSKTDFIRFILQGNLQAPGIGSYWFLYAYMGLLIVLPFLRTIANSLDKEKFLVILAIGITFTTVLPILNLILRYYEIKQIEFNGNLTIQISYYAGSPIFFGLVGFYLDRVFNLNKLKTRHYLGLTFIFAVAIVVATFMTILEKKVTGNFSQNYLSCTLPFIVIPMFLMIKKVITDLPYNNYVCKISLLGGPLVFFVYLFDGPLKAIIYEQFFKITKIMIPSIENYPVLYSLEWGISSIIISSVICYVLRKSPFIRKYI